MLADAETPITLYHKLSQRQGGAFLLESAGGGEPFGRYSFVGGGLTQTLRIDGGIGTMFIDGEPEELGADPLGALRTALERRRIVMDADLPPFVGGAVGYLGLGCVQQVAAGGTDNHDSLPQGAFLFADQLVIFDHVRHRLTAMVLIESGSQQARTEGQKRLNQLVEDVRAPLALPLLHAHPEASEFDEPQGIPTRAAYVDAVLRAQEQMVNDEIIRINMSRRWTLTGTVDPLMVYRELRALEPSPYMYLLQFDDHHVVGASSEVLVRVIRGDLTTRLTLRGGARATEYNLLVDMARNDLGRVAKPGSIAVHNLSRDEHLHSTAPPPTSITGTLDSGFDAIDALNACFPPPKTTGAPKCRAIAALGELEPHRHSIDAGVVGWFGYDGDLDSCVAQRTIVIGPEQVNIQVGIGIMHDIDPEEAANCCSAQARSTLLAAQRAQTRGSS